MFSQRNSSSTVSQGWADGGVGHPGALLARFLHPRLETPRHAGFQLRTPEHQVLTPTGEHKQRPLNAPPRITARTNRWPFVTLPAPGRPAESMPPSRTILFGPANKDQHFAITTMVRQHHQIFFWRTETETSDGRRTPRALTFILRFIAATMMPSAYLGQDSCSSSSLEPLRSPPVAHPLLSLPSSQHLLPLR